MNNLLRAVLVMLFLALVPAVFAQKSSDITQFGRDIHVQADQKLGDLTCINCSVYVRGEVAGDVTVLFGRILIDDNAQVAGDVTTVGGDVRVNHSARIAGDVTAVGGSVNRQPDASVAGDVTSLGGGGWLLLIFGTPLVILALLVALVVWLLRRERTVPAPVRA